MSNFQDHFKVLPWRTGAKLDFRNHLGRLERLTDEEGRTVIFSSPQEANRAGISMLKARIGVAGQPDKDPVTITVIARSGDHHRDR